RVEHALLDRWDDPRGDHPALDRVDELEAGPRLERLDLDMAVAELAPPAGLLLMATVGLGRLANRLLIWNAGRLQVHLGAEARLQSLDDNLDVHLGETGDDLLAGLRVAVQVDRGVLFLEPAQGGEDLILVAL